MAMIHDEELRQLFQVECTEHLQQLETALLHLEQYPHDSECHKELLRELHSLKGSARMLGVDDVEQVAHRMEDILRAISTDSLTLTADLVDRLEVGLDALQKMAAEALTGTKSTLVLADVMATLHVEALPAIYPTDEATTMEPRFAVPGTAAGVTPEPTITPTALYTYGAQALTDTDIAIDGVATSPGIDTTATTKILEAPQPQKSFEADITSPQIDTIRVDPKKLDLLMTHAGELVVTKTHIDQWLGKIESLIALWDDVAREVKQHGFADDSRLTKMQSTLLPLRQAAFEDSTALNRIAYSLEGDIRSLRMLPLERVFQLFPRTVRDLARSLAKEVQLSIQGGDTTADKQLIEMLKDPLMHLIRNAIHHGIELPDVRRRLGKSAEATISLRARRTAANIEIEVADDGKGLDLEAIKHTASRLQLCSAEELTAMSPQRLQALIFTPGFSTSADVNAISGRGVGLDVVRAAVERLKGTVNVESSPGQGCCFRLSLPLTLATTRVFLVNIAKHSYAIPVEFVRIARYVPLDTVFTVQDQPTISMDGEAIAMTWLEDLLELPKSRRDSHKLDGSPQRQPCLILEVNNESLGVFVDEIVEELEIVLKPAGPLLNRVRNVEGITILGSGMICVVLNPFDLLRTAQKRGRSNLGGWQAVKSSGVAVTGGVAVTDTEEDRDHKPLILLAEDSITTRTQEKRVLEMAGYEVVTAVDGLAAFNILGTRPFEAVVSDIEMPNMDGLTLTSKIRQDQQYEHLPIVLVTSLASEADRKRGMEVGADAYIAKSAFNQQLLLDTLNRLV